jgi:acid phosphatase type 7
MEELERALDLLCLLLPPEDLKQCRAFVQSLIASLESTDKSWVEDYTPQQFCSVLGFCQTYCCVTPYWPQEVHISLTQDPTSIFVSWVTQCNQIFQLILLLFSFVQIVIIYL